jgi:LmbE family N-acetylglucosaminyl deacetylase
MLREIVAFRPTVIFTFGPDGGYGHPDHVALSAAVTETWEIYLARILPSEPAPSLYYAYFPRHRRRLLDRMVRWLDARQERFGGDIDFITALLHLAEEARDLGAIADHLETRWFPPGTFVIEQGEAPATLYLILSGEAEAVREHDDGTMEHLGWLEPGHFFGEIGIARSQPRNAHVIARTPLTCLLFAPAEPTRYEGRGAGAHLPLATAGSMTDGETWGEATTRIDVSAFIDAKMAALAAYRSQFAFNPGLVPTGLLTELFGVEYFVRAKSSRALETDIA